MSTTGAGSGSKSLSSTTSSTSGAPNFDYMVSWFTSPEVSSSVRSFSNVPMINTIGIECKRCYSYAREFALESPTGYYAEGYIVNKKWSGAPVWHAWYMTDANTMYDNEKDTHEDWPVRRGIMVPTKTVKEYMKNERFKAKFEFYTEMPFHRACVELKLPMDWLTKQNTFEGGKRSRRRKSTRRSGRNGAIHAGRYSVKGRRSTRRSGKYRSR